MKRGREREREREKEKGRRRRRRRKGEGEGEKEEKKGDEENNKMLFLLSSMRSAYGRSSGTEAYAHLCSVR